MAWFLLVLAGLLEVVWALALKYTQGLTRPVPTIVTAVAYVASMVLLARAVRTIPIGTGYAVWVGIGASGAAIGGALLFSEPLSAPRVAFLVLLVTSIVGLKWTSSG